MNCPRTSRPHSIRPARTGFTLVELLVAMAIISILVGMLSFALIPALNRSREFTIQQEMTQLEGSIEKFKIKYGFYPPSWMYIVNGNGATTAADRVNNLLPFINRIAPNHEESIGVVGSRLIDAWWDEIGQNIHFDDGDDLVFWLSALTPNKQFPLTGDGRSSGYEPAYNDGNMEREVFYDFDSAQLEIEGVAAHYLQPAGKEVPYLYIDSRSYEIGPNLASPVPFAGYSNGLYDSLSNLKFENPDSFQLITFGMDGLPGVDTSYDVATQYDQWTNWGRTLVEADDNICNFSQGRLDRMKLGSIDTTNTNQ